MTLFQRTTSVAARPLLPRLLDQLCAKQWVGYQRTLLAFVFLALSVYASGASPQNVMQPASADGARIDLLSLGYTGLPATARQSGAANISIDFLDSDHVLVTFNPRRMFQRLPDCPPNHADRLIHAVILRLPDGQVVKETDWYLHDSLRYLWPMGSGRFLLRRLNRLYEVNSSFEEKLILDSPEELHWVSVTPDGRQIIAETPDDSARKNKAQSGHAVKITFLDASSLAVQRVMRSKTSIRLGATSSGFADVVQTGGSTWLVRFGPALRDRTNITRVRSRVAPNIVYGTANTLLIGRCSPSKGGYRMSAFTVTGTHLWKQSWGECRYTPVSKGSEDGNRVALVTATIRSTSPNPADALISDSAEEELEQRIQVLETASGKTVLTARAEQAVLDGANVSLSPDGTKLAVLDRGAIVLYSLQAASDEERTKYLAVRSDIPPPNVPLPQTGSPPTEEEIDISGTSADATDRSVSPTESVPDSVASQSASAVAPSVAPSAYAGKAGVPTPTLTLHTGTQLVALDVVVTDSHGRMVKGLEQSDFIVAEDGKPQTVRQFREYANGLTEPQAQDRNDNKPEQKAEKLSPNLFSNFDQPASPRSVTVILFDLLNTPLADQTHAQNELLKVLKSKPKDSQFALCVLSDKLQMIQGFTDDDAVLMAAARSKRAMTRHKSHLNSDSALVTLEDGKTTAQFRPELEFFVQSILLQESQARGFAADRRMYVTIDAFAQLARYLYAIPGRKNLIWLSGSFTLGISPDSVSPDREQMAFSQVRDYGENLKKVSNLLAESHVALYPVDVKGLVTDPLFTAQTNDNLSPISMTGSTPLGPARNGRVSFASPADTAIPLALMQSQANEFGSAQIGEHTTMDRLASQTGGRAFYNTNGIAKAIDTALEEGNNYYALSYSPAKKDYNGAFRKIKVSLVNKKHHLAYREGYYAVDPSASAKPAKDLISGLAQAAMQQGSPQSRQIVLAARILPLGKPRILENTATAKPSKGKRKKDAAPEEMQLYSIDYAVKSTDLRFSAAADGGYQGVLNFMVTAFDEDGKLAASQISELDAHFKPEFFPETMKEGIRLHQEVEIPAKSTAMRLGVEDVATSHIGTIEVPLPVKAPPGDRTTTRRSMPPIEADE